jgi:hypothetical protein
MKLSLRTFASLLGTAVIAFGGLLVTASPAAADPQPPCYEWGCNGKDPHTLGCDQSAYTITSFPINYGSASVLLRYSTRCHANWTTISTPGYNIGANAWIENTYGDWYSVGAVSYGNAWTAMVNGYPLARSCAVDNVSYTWANPGCTAWL